MRTQTRCEPGAVQTPGSLVHPELAKEKSAAGLLRVVTPEGGNDERRDADRPPEGLALRLKRESAAASRLQGTLDPDLCRGEVDVVPTQPQAAGYNIDGEWVPIRSVSPDLK